MSGRERSETFSDRGVILKGPVSWPLLPPVALFGGRVCRWTQLKALGGVLGVQGIMAPPLMFVRTEL